MEPPMPQTELVAIEDPVVETVPDEISQAPQIQNKVIVALLKRFTRERRSVILLDYVVYLREHDYDIGYVVDPVTYTDVISCPQLDL